MFLDGQYPPTAPRALKIRSKPFFQKRNGRISENGFWEEPRFISKTVCYLLMIIYIYIYWNNMYIYMYIEQRTIYIRKFVWIAQLLKVFALPGEKFRNVPLPWNGPPFFPVGLGSQTTTPQMDGCIKDLSHPLTSDPVCFGSCPQSYPALVSMKPSDERLKKRSDDALQLFAERIRKSTANNWLAPGTLVLLRTTSVSR